MSILLVICLSVSVVDYDLLSNIAIKPNILYSTSVLLKYVLFNCNIINQNLICCGKYSQISFIYINLTSSMILLFYCVENIFIKWLLSQILTNTALLGNERML